MKLVTSLLLGSAAAMAAVAGAQAADLPFRKAAPVDYVRVCDWTKDAGYFYIPGTDTCLRIGGEVRFEYAYADPSNSFAPGPAVNGTQASGTTVASKQRHVSGFFARGNIEVDARTQTAYGLLRAFVRLQGNRAGGWEASPTNAKGTGDGVALDRAFIEFSGFTAGRRQSYFDFYADNYNYDGIATSDQSTTVLAYTATFGGGFSATISVEDPIAANRRDAIGTLFANNAPLTPGLGTAITYAGLEYPDVVGLVRYDNDSWGAVQLSAAYHDINTIPTTLEAGSVRPATSTEAGFAVQLGVDLKLPMIAAGDELWLEGAYQEGAYNYMDCCGGFNNGFTGQLLGGFQHQDVDAVAVVNANGNGYHLQLGKGFSVMGAFQHYFTPQFHDVLYGSYEEIGYGNRVRNTFWGLGGIGDAQEFRVGNQFIFTPVHNFDIGVDVMYAKINQDLAGDTKANFRANHPGIDPDPDTFEVRLRLNRDF